MFTQARTDDGDRLTLDHKHTEEELRNTVYEECELLVISWISKNGKKCVENIEDITPYNIAEKIICENDLIYIYNKMYDKHRSEKAFGIKWFCEWLAREVPKVLKKCLISKHEKELALRHENEELCEDWEKY